MDAPSGALRSDDVKDDGGLSGLGAPVLGESVKPAVPRGYERLTGALDARSCGPRAGVCSEGSGLNMVLVILGWTSDFGFSRGGHT